MGLDGTGNGGGKSDRYCAIVTVEFGEGDGKESPGDGESQKTLLLSPIPANTNTTMVKATYGGESHSKTKTT